MTRSPGPVRPAGPDDAEAIVAMIACILETEWYPTLSPRGRRFLTEAMTAERICANMAGDCRYQVSEDGQGIAGVVAMRSHKHLLKLFVAQRARGTGLAARLWQAARAASVAAGHRGSYTLSAVPAAMPLYRRLGFVIDGRMTDEDGIERIPMRIPN